MHIIIMNQTYDYTYLAENGNSLIIKSTGHMDTFDE